MKKLNLKAQRIFERHEKKYLLTQGQYRQLRAALESEMEQDCYGLHTICSLYYDTEDFAVIRRCLEKPDFKEKLRLRSYGVPAPEQTVYMELKKKLDGVTYKRRVPVAYGDAVRYLGGGEKPAIHGQIFSEIDCYVTRNPVRAAMLLAYDRIALFGREDPDFRVTFDRAIRFRTTQLDLSAGDFGTHLIPPDRRMMEIKTAGAIPFWFSRILSELQIYPISFSKYGRAYLASLQTQEGVRHAG